MACFRASLSFFFSFFHSFPLSSSLSYQFSVCLNVKTLERLSAPRWLSTSVAPQALRFAFLGTEPSVCNIYYPSRFQQLLLALARPPAFCTSVC